VIIGFSQGCIAAIAATAGGGANTIPPCCRRVRALVLVGCPAIHDDAIAAEPRALPSLHLMGEADAVVSVADSLETASLFEAPRIVTHSGGHSFPRSKRVLDEVASFLRDAQAPMDVQAFRDGIDEELQMIEAMFGDALERLEEENGVAAASSSRIGLTFQLTLSCDGEPAVRFYVPPRYPDAAPTVTLVKPDPRRVKWSRKLHAAMEEAGAQRLGVPMLFELINEATAAIEELAANSNDLGAAGGADDLIEAEHAAARRSFDAWDGLSDAEQHDAMGAAYAAAEALDIPVELRRMAKSGGGAQRYVIGLVGKPSAGKSSFFNAVTDPQSEADAAKVGAFPFTTIEPNYGHAFVGVPCACSSYGLEDQCAAEHGHFPGTTNRRVPVLVKDVAGLVPGAYKGRGKGNRFLNDLCDANVLVHIVDGSGRSTSNGDIDESNASDPVSDITWIRNEIHAWVFDNVRAKWDIIRRKAPKFFGMFSGYHMPLSLVEGIMKRVFLTTAEQANHTLRTWTTDDLHRFIAVTLMCRFPTVIALNKADYPKTVQVNAALVRDRFPQLPVVPMSAAAELSLLQLRAAGCIAYQAGARDFEETSDAGAGGPAKDKIAKCRTILGLLGTTGVHEVLHAAFSLRPSSVLFPVPDDVTRPGVRPFHKALLLKLSSTADDIARAIDETRSFARTEVVLLPFSAAGQPQKTLLRRDASVPAMAAVKVFFR
jgi:ribosome-binding ATPase YchF (GTP1/OBG family)